MEYRYLQLTDYYRIAAENREACDALIQKLRSACPDAIRELEQKCGEDILDKLADPMAFSRGLQEGDDFGADTQAVIAMMNRHQIGRAYFLLMYAAERKCPNTPLFEELIRINRGILRLIGKA